MSPRPKVTFAELQRLARRRCRVEVEWWDATTACADWGDRKEMRNAKLAHNKTIGYMMHVTRGDSNMLGRLVLAQNQCVGDGMTADAMVIPLVNVIGVVVL
jgi:hypothetical protein